MAKKKKNTDFSFLNQALNKRLSTDIQNSMENSYKKTYYADNKDAKQIDSIRRVIDRDLNGLMDRNKLRNDGHSISTLYARTLALNDDDSLVEFKKALQDESMLADLMDMYSQNAIQRDIDREIDVVLKYVNKLDTALSIKADSVLKSESFSSDPITITPITNESSKNMDSTSGSESNTRRYSAKSDIDAFKKKYHLPELADEIYRKTAKYGEQFVYIVSYNKALKRLLRKNNNAQLLAEDTMVTLEQFDDLLSSVNESFTIAYGEPNVERTGLTENAYFSDENNIDNLLKDDSWEDIEVEINTTGVIPGIVFEAQNARRILKETSNYIYDEDNDQVEVLTEADQKLGVAGNPMLSNNNYLHNMQSEFKKFSKEGGTLKSPQKLAMDGFTDTKKAKKDEEINIPGCIVRLLDHTMVKTLRIEDAVLGYYFIECNRDTDTNQTTFSSTLGGLRPKRSTRDREIMDKPHLNDQVLVKIARQIAQKIDAKFINSNQDLSKEIYTILKYNADNGDNKVGKIRVAFLPPEDVVHCYFDINKKTWRGKSDLSKALFPAKLLSCLYISNTIGILTRGYDRRIYNVKQTVDTNIQAVLLSVINQIKQSNFNLRQIENMNNILNITGRYNDIIFPLGADGSQPITVDIMPAQNIEIKSELMNMLEEMAVNSTGVTMEMLNSRLQEQSATHITMTNTRFLITIRDRQVKYQSILSKIFTKIYQIEYGIEDELEVTLSPPVMLNFQNSSQIISIANELIQNIVLMCMGSDNQNEALKSQLTSGLMKFYLKSMLPMEEIEKIYEEAQIDTINNQERIANRMQQANPAGGGGGAGMPGGSY